MGQLGQGHEISQWTPSIVNLSKAVAQIGCGLKHCIVLTKD